MGETTMSDKELDRHHILLKVLAKELKQVEAASILGISDRQIRNLLYHLKKDGPAGIVSKKRGKRGNRRKPDKFKDKVLALVKERYEDFGPTLAQEKLLELHGFKLGVETLRGWMIEAHLWIPRKKRRRDHLPRQKRSCFGELIQADGSPHYWFGEEEPMINATVFIDDATGKITALYFSHSETLEGYFQALEQHLTRHGRPRALYTDRHTIFCSPKKKDPTQFQRAINQFDIELILASSPQAKGRVERVNRTLQDRLVKEMRLRNIKTIEDANLFAEEFIKKFNKKFSKEPISAIDAHRPLDGYDLERLLSRFETRTLSSSGIFQFNNVFYQVQEVSKTSLKGKKVEIRVTRNNKIRVFLAEREIVAKALNEIQLDQPPLTLDRKEVLTHGQRKPISKYHPWKTDFAKAIRRKYAAA